MTEPHQVPTCNHQQVLAIPRVRAGELFQVAELSSRQLYIEAPSLRRCEQCRALLIASSTRREIQEMAEGLAALARTMKPSFEATLRLGKASDTPESLDVSRAELTPRTPRYTLSDVVLDDVTHLEVEEALAKVRLHRLIYETWGFGAVDPVGRGATINLHGPPGVGKSRTAEAIAGELGRPLLVLTAGDLESRFMGETPRNVKAAFQAARTAEAVLFFDEADSLFGKRASDVTQGVDHEVNVTKSVLLVEVEKFDGVLVVATNFPQNFDRAFVRRLTYNVRMRLPDARARRRIWSMHLTGGIPLSTARDELLDALSQESEGLAGGDILTAMRLALPAVALERGESGPLEFAHLQAAMERIRRARREIGRDVPSASSAIAMRRLISGSPGDAPATEPTPVPSEPTTVDPSRP